MLFPVIGHHDLNSRITATNPSRNFPHQYSQYEPAEKMQLLESLSMLRSLQATEANSHRGTIQQYMASPKQENEARQMLLG
jgi:hypothetical protein